MAWTVVLAIALIGGLAASLQSQFQGELDTALGTVSGVLVTYGGGGLVMLAIALIYGRGQLGPFGGLPWYTYTAGLFGLIIIAALGISVPRLGLAPALTAFIVASLTGAAVIDHFGLLGADARPIDLSRAAGLLVLAGGSWLVLR